jgi:hypothetical protein
MLQIAVKAQVFFEALPSPINLRYKLYMMQNWMQTSRSGFHVLKGLSK